MIDKEILITGPEPSEELIDVFQNGEGEISHAWDDKAYATIREDFFDEFKDKAKLEGITVTKIEG